MCVCDRYPDVLTEAQYREAICRFPADKGLLWVVRTRDAEVYVQGPVRARDHRALYLPLWHRVYRSAEMHVREASVSGRVRRDSVVFLD